MDKRLGQLIFEPTSGSIHFNVGRCPRCNHQTSLSKEDIAEFNQNSPLRLRVSFLNKILSKLKEFTRIRIIIGDEATTSKIK